MMIVQANNEGRICWLRFAPQQYTLQGSASSLRCEFSVGVELQESTFLTAEGSDGHTVSTRRFRFGPERFLW